MAHPRSEQEHVPDRRLKRGAETVGATLPVSIGGRVDPEGTIEPRRARAHEAAEITWAELLTDREAPTQTEGQIVFGHGKVESPIHLRLGWRRETHPAEAQEKADVFQGDEES